MNHALNKKLDASLFLTMLTGWSAYQLLSL